MLLFVISTKKKENILNAGKEKGEKCLVRKKVSILTEKAAQKPPSSKLCCRTDYVNNGEKNASWEHVRDQLVLRYTHILTILPPQEFCQKNVRHENHSWF